MTRAIFNNFEYQVGGSLSSSSPSYVVRQADTLIYEMLKAGQFCYVLNSRQMGKSSLRVQTMERLQAEGTTCIFIDLTGMGTRELTPEKWYAGIVQSLVTGSQLSDKIQWRTWWRERRDILSPVQRLGVFIEEVLLAEIPHNIVIFIDEIDRVLSQDFLLDDFFAWIRFCGEHRTAFAPYHRLTFALLGVATPAELIQDKVQISFDFAKPIELAGFQIHEVAPLISGLQDAVKNPDEIMQEILAWTGGQPFLTQKICQLVVANAQTEHSISITEIVQQHIIEQWEAQDEPEHLRTIRDRILRSTKVAIRLLGLYQEILQRGAIPSDGSASQMELRLSGLVVESQGVLRVYNRIYAAVFDQHWVQQKLTELRPYAEQFSGWIATGCQDETYLLQDSALKDVLTWSLGKRLSDLDYRYLVASQDLDKRKTQTMLNATEQASQLLSEVRQQIKRRIQQRRIHWKWLPPVLLGSTLAMLSLNASGLLQVPEWMVLDQFFRWRLLEPPEQQIVVVTIDESDLAATGQWPVSDSVLAKALNIIKAQKPAAIGLDIYRNFSVAPGQADLINVFRTTPNLFGIEKLAEKPVPAPPDLQSRQQVGFSDQVLDADNRVRRALLSMTSSNGEDRYSFATQLALFYLNSQNIQPKYLDADGERVQLGKVVFNRFAANDGGYVRADAGGYQILLNWRGAQQHFSTVSLQQVLANKIPAGQWRDRIVLMGMTAESAKDDFFTPYSSSLFRAPLPMPGVIVHANIVSQLLRSALDGRSPIQTLPKPLEWLWIGVWASVGVGIGWYWKSLAVVISATGFTISSLLGIGYLFFLQGWWIPLIPAGGAMLSAVILLQVIRSRQVERVQFQDTLKHLLSYYQAEPLPGRIALEYFKQSETRSHQVVIEQQLKLLQSKSQQES